MDFDERLGWMLFGGGIGFILGYIVRTLRDLKEEVDEVDGLVKRKLSDRKNERDDDDGFMSMRYIRDAAVLIVVALTVWMSFVSQKASNEVTKTQDEFVTVSVCNQRFLAQTIRALNERTTYTQQQIQANVAVQEDFSEFFNLLLEQPPRSEAERRKAAEDYVDALDEFVAVSTKSSNVVSQNPFPTILDLKRCLDPERYPSKKTETPDAE